MTDTERLAGLLDQYVMDPSVGTAWDLATRLIAAGVRLDRGEYVPPADLPPVNPPSDERKGRKPRVSIDPDRLARAIRSNWYEIRPVGERWVRPADAAAAIAKAYEEDEG